MIIDVNADELRTVLQLACEVEDRAADEQRAMLSLAFKLDMATMKQTVTNRYPRLSNMVGSVLQTVDDHSDGGSVRLSGRRPVRHQQALDRLRDEA